MAQNRKWGTKGRGVTTYNYNVDRKYGGTIGMQAGSTFKIFTLAAALEKDISAYEQIQAPAEKTWKGFTNCTTGAEFPPYRARNSTGSGSFNMYGGTALSVNTYFLELEYRTGLCRPVADRRPRWGWPGRPARRSAATRRSPWAPTRSHRCRWPAPTPGSPTTACSAAPSPSPRS